MDRSQQEQQPSPLRQGQQDTSIPLTPRSNDKENVEEVPSDEEAQDYDAARAGNSHTANPNLSPILARPPIRYTRTLSFPSKRSSSSSLRTPLPPHGRPSVMVLSPSCRVGSDDYDDDYHPNHFVPSAGLLHTSHNDFSISSSQCRHGNNSPRRRAQTWTTSSPERRRPYTDCASNEISVLEEPPDEESSETSSDTSLSDTYNVPSLNSIRRRSRRLQSLRVGLVVCAYLALATQPTHLSKLVGRRKQRKEQTALLSPQHGREVLFPPRHPMLVQEESSNRTRVKTRRRPIMAHAKVSPRAAPIFVLKQQEPETGHTRQPPHLDSNDNDDAPSKVGLLLWVALLWLVLETGCREAQSRFQYVLQRRRRDAWQRRLQ